MAAILSPEKRAFLTRDFLSHQYHILKKSTYRIAQELKVSSRTIRLHLIQEGISLRTQKTSFISRNQSKAKNPNFKHGNSSKIAYCIDCGKPLSDYRKTRCLSCNKKGSRSHFYGNPPQHGKHFFYGGSNFRSSWEYNFAKYLDSNKIEWKYEIQSFILSSGETYTPDFYLPEINEWIEVKGYWRDDAFKKFQQFKLDYPFVKISVYNEKKLQDLGVI